MTSQEFIIWMKGFISAAHEYAPTPKQWDILKDELSKVSDYEDREQLENDFFGAWAENDNRMDIIGQNGNEGIHYDTDMGIEPTLDDLQIGPDGAYFDGFDDYGQRIPSPKWTSTNTNEVDDDEFDIGGSE
jgi:hypothetical protein